ncbi:MAG: hypothetical protein Q7W13_02840 [Bacteroidia bacterium]|nr:hypothetical protein [Bacteroidia bacterium]
MKPQQTILLIIVLMTFGSCKNFNSKIIEENANQAEYYGNKKDTALVKHSKEKVFPKISNLSEYKRSVFIPTLESKISNKKNAVYCVTLLYAWDEIRKTITTPLQIEDKFSDLSLLNNSKSYIGVLDSEDYEAKGEVIGDKIIAKASFKKSLPFEVRLQGFDNEIKVEDKLKFDNIKVASFGTFGCFRDISSMIEILFYEDDNNFILKLIPKDKQHEIVLFKSEIKFNSMTEIIEEISKKVEIGKVESQNKKLRWKYRFEEMDVVIIPKFKFNIETNYKALEGQNFKSNESVFYIETASQKTAFILDENGADIESEALMAASSNKPKPKKMRFDKPFFLMLKKADCMNPYFGLWTTNTELMVKE